MSEVKDHEFDNLKTLVQAANDGDQDARARLQFWLDDRPDIWQRLGDLVAHSETMLVDLVAGGDQLLTESIKRHLADMKYDLAGPSPSHLVKLTFGRIVACWLQLQFAESQANQTGQPLTHAGFWLRRLATADRMYRAAIKSLALVKKMLPAAESTPTAATLRFPCAGAR